MKIGVIEDDPGISGLLKELLELHNHTVSLYKYGWDMLEVMARDEQKQQAPFDILLVDLLLPGSISGIQVISHAVQFFPSLPIVVISAVAAPDLENVKRMYPQVHVLQKPFKLAHLIEVMELTQAPGL